MLMGIAAVRAQRAGEAAQKADEAVSREAYKIVKFFTGNKTGRYRAVTKVVRRIQIGGPYMIAGEMWDVKTRSIGAGVYELSLVKYQAD